MSTSIQQVDMLSAIAINLRLPEVRDYVAQRVLPVMAQTEAAVNTTNQLAFPALTKPCIFSLSGWCKL